jgi:hypothetical protein
MASLNGYVNVSQRVTPNTKSTQQTLGGKNPTNGNQWNLTRQKHAQTNYMIFDKFAKPWGLQQRTCVF